MARFIARVAQGVAAQFNHHSDPYDVAKEAVTVAVEQLMAEISSYPARYLNCDARDVCGCLRRYLEQDDQSSVVQSALPGIGDGQ